MSDLFREHFWACWWLVLILGVVWAAMIRDMFVAFAESVRAKGNDS